MMFYVLVGAPILYYIFNKNYEKLRYFILCETIFVTIFLFSSCDPFIGLPIYFILMTISCLISLLKPIKLKKESIVLFLCALLLLCIQIFNLYLGKNVTPALLINESNTDTTNLQNELYLPTLSFTVIKHFVFLIVYYIFLLLNRDILIDKWKMGNLIKTTMKLFELLFICIIIEWLIVNIFDGYNDRALLAFIFNIKELNQDTNWVTWGGYSVCFCFNERSSMGIVFAFYLVIIMKRNLIGKDYLSIILSIVAIYCTGSTTALGIASLSLVIIFVRHVFFVKKQFITKMFLVLLALVLLGVVLANRSFLFEKIEEYFSGDTAWGSAYFRSNANKYGINCFLYSPLIGLGIGTVYCHSLLIQTLANIGILGVLFAVLFHCSIVNYKWSSKHIMPIIITIISFSMAFMVENFTSPLILLIFVILMYTDKVNDNEKYMRDFKL